MVGVGVTVGVSVRVGVAVGVSVGGTAVKVDVCVGSITLVGIKVSVAVGVEVGAVCDWHEAARKMRQKKMRRICIVRIPDGPIYRWNRIPRERRVFYAQTLRLGYAIR